ncbi:hypothetical protein D3C78_1610270 [compost metagenome]
MGAVDDVLRGFGAGQHRQALVEVFLAQFGDGEGASGTLDQAHAQPFFQQRDTAAEPGLGNVQGASGGREAAIPDDLDKVVEIIQVVHGPSAVLKIGIAASI